MEDEIIKEDVAIEDTGDDQDEKVETETGTDAGDNASGDLGEETEAAEEEAPTITQTALQRRVAREQRRHDRELQAAKDAFEARIKALEEKVQPFTDPKPKIDDYVTQEDYTEALVDWKLKGGQGKTSSAAAPSPKEFGAEDFDFAREELIETGKEKYPDWDKVVVTDMQALPITVPMAMALVELAEGPDITYYLGKNPKEAKRISILSPARQVVEIENLKRLFKTQAGTQQNISTIKPVGSGRGPVGQVKKDPSKMGFDEFKAWRKAGGGR